MLEVTLIINSPQGTSEMPFEGDSVTFGRTDASQVVIAGDTGLSRRHATIHRDEEALWVVDEGSTNGSFVNGGSVSAEGQRLADGDEIRIGNYTTIRIQLNARPAEAASAGTAVDAPAASPDAAAPPPPAASSSSSLSLALILPLIAVVILLLGGVGFALYKFTAGSKKSEPPRDEIASTTADSETTSSTGDTTPAGDELLSPLSETPPAETSPLDSSSAPPLPTGATGSLPPIPNAPSASTETPILSSNVEPPPSTIVPAATLKLYQKMTDEEKNEFIKQRAQHISIMMGRRPYSFSPDALAEIKYWLDAFSKRIGNNRTGLWGGDTRFIFDRARQHAPVIIQAFKEHRVPVVIGLYIPFIETEYTNITTDNFAGAAGLFQFLGPTAEAYGVPSSERTNVPRMAPAAAKYFRDNIMRFGDDSMSVALSIAGYNRAPESVMRDLRNVLNEKDNSAKERTFWTLIANKGKLDHYFQNENKNYVPRFFAAAIMGETPWAFGLEMRPLSTYTRPDPSTQLAAQPTP
ncbi:MAG TPA: FHA domain-containing protein [Pyrinomonadaceae bacterium]|jgi:pSer/pThr/pTyr-binding forkhead associated (FHA) protein